MVPLSGLPLAPSCEACTLLRSQWTGLWGRGLGRLRGCELLSCLALEWGPLPPLFHEPDWCLPPTKDLTAPPSGFLVVQPSQLLLVPPCQDLSRIWN